MRRRPRRAAASCALTCARSWSGSGRAFGHRPSGSASAASARRRRAALPVAAARPPTGATQRLRRRAVEREVQLEHVDARLAEDAERAARACSASTSARTVSTGMPRALATRASWYSAAATLMSGSSPLPDAVTRSTGTARRVARIRVAQRLDAILDRVGERRIARPLVGAGRRAAVVGLRRGRRRPAPEVLRDRRTAGRSAPSRRPCRRLTIRLPLAARGKRELGDAGDDERIDDAGQHRQHDEHPQRREGMVANMMVLRDSGEVQRDQQHVDRS